MQLAIAIFNVPIIQVAFESQRNKDKQQKTIGFKNE